MVADLLRRASDITGLQPCVGLAFLNVKDLDRCTSQLVGGKFNDSSALTKVAAKPDGHDIPPASPASLLFDVYGGTRRRRTARQKSQGRRRQRLMDEEDKRRRTDYVHQIDNRRQRVDTRSGRPEDARRHELENEVPEDHGRDEDDEH